MSGKFVIPTEDKLPNEEQPIIKVKSHFQPGKLMQEIRKAQSEDTSTSVVAEPCPPPCLINLDTEPADEGMVCDAPSKGASSSTFVTAFGHLKESKFYEAPMETKDKTEESAKKPEGYPLKTNSILVNSRQKGNPLLKSIRNVPWEFAEIEPDYIMGQTTCALFLSLRYFNLYPNYIHERLKSLGKSFQLRVLVAHIDVADPYPPLRDLSRIAIFTDCTLMLAWSSEEAGKYIETYKILENKPVDLLMEKQEDNSYSKIIDSLAMVKSVNRTNATSLLTTYGSLDRIFSSNPDELSLIPGMGPLKAKKLHSVINQPFLKTKPS